ncbi:hypothetical protein F2Q69_00001442 [Brassica cretica]|uniref:Uncharacterized protein n=1 Tax=Brassica cretica TaxID=69181 RepID=A0A8S9PA04_BRACR|nr:hypothetical protein F2Q69_00001442 [Brassica cretica]
MLAGFSFYWISLLELSCVKVKDTSQLLRRMYGSRLRAYSIKLTKWMVRLLLPSTMLLPTCSDALALWLDFENGNEALNWWRFRRDLGKFGRTCGLSLA